MKKKLFIGTVLPTVAALGVIGSGFSLWIFSDSNSVKNDGSIGVAVTNVLTLTNTTIEVTNKESCVLNFDQTALDSANETRPANPNGKGLTWSDAQTATFKSGTNESYEVDWAENVKLTFTTTIKVPTAMANYISLTSTQDFGTLGAEDSTNSATNGYTTYTYTFNSTDKATELGTSSWTSGNLNVSMFDFNKISASYKTEPTSLTEYKDMREALKIGTDDALKISVDYVVTAEIVSSN